MSNFMFSFYRIVISLVVWACLGGGSLVYAQKDSVHKTTEKNKPERHEKSILETITYTAADSVEIAFIHLECHRKTKDRIIFREIALQEGDKIHRKDIEQVLEREKSKLFNTNLFVTVDIFYEEFTKGKLDIVISFTEQWYFYPIPIIELADRNFNVWWNQQNRSLDRLEYGFRLKQRNFRGRNETLDILLQAGFTRKFNVNYSIPYINKAQTVGLSFYGGYAENTNVGYTTLRDTLRFVSMPNNEVLTNRFYGGMGLTVRSRFYDRHSFSVGYRHEEIADTIMQLNANYFGEGQTRQRYVELQYTFFRDLRDRANYPLKGYYFLFSVEQKGMGVHGDLSIFTARSEFTKFIPLFKNTYFSSSALLKMSFATHNFPYNQRKGIGFGRDVIRGYEYNVVESQQHFISKNTLRYKLVDKQFHFKKFPHQFSKIPLTIYPKLYFDTGYAQLYDVYPSNQLPNRWLWGAGVGMDIVIYTNAVFRVEYSLADNGTKGLRLGWKADF